MTHIPGPWHVDPHSMWICAPSAKGGDCHIADIRGWGYLTGKGSGALGLPEDEAIAIQKANALLIAAAPDLLARLEFIEDICKRGHIVFDRETQEERDDALRCFREDNRAAIAKATGAA